MSQQALAAAAAAIAAFATDLLLLAFLRLQLQLLLLRPLLLLPLLLQRPRMDASRPDSTLKDPSAMFPRNYARNSTTRETHQIYMAANTKAQTPNSCSMFALCVTLCLASCALPSASVCLYACSRVRLRPGFESRLTEVLFEFCLGFGVHQFPSPEWSYSSCSFIHLGR